jgi:hypothetical protein
METLESRSPNSKVVPLALVTSVCCSSMLILKMGSVGARRRLECYHSERKKSPPLARSCADTNNVNIVVMRQQFPPALKYSL